jgi:hypothetical protein
MLQVQVNSVVGDRLVPQFWNQGKRQSLELACSSHITPSKEQSLTMKMQHNIVISSNTKMQSSWFLISACLQNAETGGAWDKFLHGQQSDCISWTGKQFHAISQRVYQQCWVCFSVFPSVWGIRCFLSSGFKPFFWAYFNSKLHPTGLMAPCPNIYQQKIGSTAILCFAKYST